MIVFLFWIGFSIAVGTAAGPRGRSQGAWLLLSLAISPVLAACFLFALPPLKPAPVDDPLESPELRERFKRWLIESERENLKEGLPPRGFEQ